MRTVSSSKLAIIAASILGALSAYNYSAEERSHPRRVGQSEYTKAPYINKTHKKKLRKIAHASRMRNKNVH